MDSTMPTEINVITLNCWGLKFISKWRNERLVEIGKRIASADPVPQIVGLQEFWTQRDYQCIRKETKHVLPYGKFYHSGIFGGGLAILSKWPIEESSMVRYPLNGRPTAFFRGDWYVGKGIACARIRYGAGLKDVVEVFTTHVSEASLRTNSQLTPVAPRALREGTSRFIYLPSDSPSMGNHKIDAWSRRTWASCAGTWRFQHDSHVTRS
jgi:hypothetical protein